MRPFLLFCGLLLGMADGWHAGEAKAATVAPDVTAASASVAVALAPEVVTVAAPMPDGGPVTTAVKAASGWKAPKVRLVVPDVRMCPGQEYDLPVYIETEEPVGIVDLTVGFRFPHYMIVEPVDNTFTDLHPGMRARGGALANYKKEPHGDFPDHCWQFNWYTTNYSDPFKPASGDVLFRIRVLYKQEGEGMVDFIDDSYIAEGFGDCHDYTHMNIIPPPEVGRYAPVYPDCDTSYVRVSTPPVVEAMTDTTVCVNSKTRLWAKGGVRYAWRDISPVDYAYRPALNDILSANPVFCPLDPGYYTYEVKITDKAGCSARDTVQYLVLDNGLNLDLPEDTLLEAGQRADLTAVVYGGYPPYALRWAPAGLAEVPAMTDLKPARTGGRVDTANRSLPLERPQWFDVTVTDRYCTFEKRQSVNVAGSEIEGEMTLRPPYFCQGASSHVVDLHIDARGGYGRYSYAWSAENLEPGAEAPVFENLTDGPSTRLRCYARCVVRVRVADRMRRMAETVFTDTLQIVEQTKASLAIEDLNGSVCERTEMRFKAVAQNGGDHPRFSWVVDGETVATTEEPEFTTYWMEVGSTLGCKMESDRACVENPTVEAKTITPDILVPGYMVVHAAFGDDTYNVACGDSLSLAVWHRQTGRRFRLRWYRNDRQVVADRYVTYESNATDDRCLVSAMPRGGYYAFYRAAITESDRPCLLWDSVTTEPIYPRLEPTKAATVGQVYVPADEAEGVCEGSPLIVYARDLTYLPSQFRLVWYVRRQGAAMATPLGYYAVGSAFTDNAAYGRNLGSASEFAGGDEYWRAQKWILKEFPLWVTTAAAPGGNLEVGADDEIFYRLETVGACGAASVNAEAQPFTVKMRAMATASPVSAIAMDIVPSRYCEGAEVKCFPAEPAENVRYTWYINDNQITGLRPDQTAGDTLIVNMYNGMKVSLKATSTETCLPSTVSRETLSSHRIGGMHNGFQKISQSDTMLCADAPVQLWALGVSYRDYGFSDRKMNGLRPHLIKYEDSVTVGWAESLADVKADRFIYTGMRFVTSVDSARFGDRSAGLYEDSAVIGTQTFYAKIRSHNGCTGYDSIRVTVGYDRTPTVVVVPEPAFPWCEGNLSGISLKIEASFLGAHPMFALGRVQPDGKTDWAIGTDPVWPYHEAWCRKGYRVIGGARSSMLTCGNPEGETEPIPLVINERPHAWLQLTDTLVCSGDELIVPGYGCTESDYVRLSELGYTEDEMMAVLADNYLFRWVDVSTGETVSEERLLRVRPTRTTRYTLYMNDKSGHCVETAASLDVRVGIRSAVDVVFTEAVTGREVPFSLCAGSDSTELYTRVVPKMPTGAKPYVGLLIADAATGAEKDYWIQRDMNYWPPVKYYPGERLIYCLFHDTLACDGLDYVMDSVDLTDRPSSPGFIGGPDTLLCPDQGARLRVAGALTDLAPVASGLPSLRKYLEAQGVAGASALGDEALVYWTPALDLTTGPGGQDGLAAQTSFTPLATPAANRLYEVWAYNEYGCIQSDSVRVERFDEDFGALKIVLKRAYPEDSVLCDQTGLWLEIDRRAGSVLSIFDSLVWKRVPAAEPDRIEVLAQGETRRYIEADHGDSLFVVGYIREGNACSDLMPSRVVSNKIAVASYRRPAVTLSQTESAACADSTLELKVSTDRGAQLYWSLGPENGGGIGVETPDYDILALRYPDPFSAVCQLRTKRDFTVKAMAYDHPACYTVDSLRVAVKQTVDTLRIALSAVPPICGDALAVLEVTAVSHATAGWRWWYNGRPMLNDDLKQTGAGEWGEVSPTADFSRGVSNVSGGSGSVSSGSGSVSGGSGSGGFGSGLATGETGAMEDGLVGHQERRLEAYFMDGDRIWAEALSNERCAYRGLAVSDTVRIRRSATPAWEWLDPIAPAAEAGGLLQLKGCADEAVQARLLVKRGQNLQGAWRTLAGVEDRVFSLLETTDRGRVYGLDLTYPAPQAGQIQGAGRLYMHLGYAECEATDSVTVIGLAYDTLYIEIEASETSVCAGEEVGYRLSRCGGVDSVAWYVNGQVVKSGFIGWAAAPANSYTYRPKAGDKVYAIGHAVWAPCVTEAFTISNVLGVEVIDGRTEAGTIDVSLTASADSVCGAGMPVYTVRGRGFDSLYWYANGRLAAVTDLRYGRTDVLPQAQAKAQAEDGDDPAGEMTATWQRVPRLGTEGADSLYVVAVRRERICRARAEATSNVVSVYRREQPVVRIAPRDTVLPQGGDFVFSASGATAYVWWTDLDNEIIGGDASVRLTVAPEPLALYVMGYEPAYGLDSLAGGGSTPPAPGDYAQFGCRGYDRVAVRPSVQDDEEPLIYIPNTIVKNSVIPADRVFKVYGQGIVRVDMKIFRDGGNLLYSETGESPVWKAYDVPSGNYVYEVTVELKKGGPVKKRGWITVLE